MKKKEIKQKLKDKKKIITAVLMLILVGILFFSGYSMGKEYSKIDINAETQIAKPILVVENNPEINLQTVNDKGYYDFVVKNYNEEGAINQVDLLYNIEILSKLDKAIVVKLYKNGEELKLQDNKTENMTLPKGIEQEEKYQMQISYDKTKETSIEDIVEEIQIKVHSEQAKS